MYITQMYVFSYTTHVYVNFLYYSCVCFFHAAVCLFSFSTQVYASFLKESLNDNLSLV